MVFYVYFSHGRAYVDKKQDGSERYHRFLYGNWNSYRSSGESATITFVSTGYADEYFGYDFIGNYLVTDALVAVISDTDIGAWWNAVSGDGKIPINVNGIHPLDASKGEFGWGIPYDNATRERVRKGVPVDIITIDWPGIVEINIEPDNYLFCDLDYLDVTLRLSQDAVTKI